MNKILIVGHESSHYKDLEKILYSYGMAKAMPSHTYQITPINLGKKLLSHLNNFNKPNKIWDNLAFDLFLANASQSFWGWADSNAISLLEYWANFDEDITFILIYDKPDEFIKYIINNKKIDILNEKLIQEEFDKWSNYNQKLLTFYQKYPNRCLLVNGKQVIKNPKKYIQLLTKKMDCKMNINHTDTSLQESKLNGDNVFYNQQVIDFLIQQLLIKKYEDKLQLFDDMQNYANIPFNLKNKNNSLEVTLPLLKQTIQQKAYINQLTTNKKTWQKEQLKKENLLITQIYNNQENIEKYFLQSQHYQNKIETISQNLQIAEQENSSLIRQLHQLQHNFEELKREELKRTEKQEKQKDMSNLQQENSLLITQLHLLQEELEKFYLANQYLQFNQEKPSYANQSTKPIYYGAADRVKQDLPYRLGTVMIEYSKSTTQLIKLPFALIKEFIKFQKAKKNQQNLPRIEEYQDLYKAEKVKQHLSYRLGKILIDNIQSPKGVLNLPIKLIKESIEFKKNK